MRAVLVAALATLACTASGSGRSPVSTIAPGDTIEIVVAATTDVHGRVRGWDYYRNVPDSARGLARLATVVDSLRREFGDRVVLVDAGDLLQGNPLTYYAARVDTTGPHPVIAAMNTMGYDAAAIGNHEFNYGLELLERARREARFPMLAANAWRPGGERAYPASTIVQRAGVRIGIVGATNPGAAVWDRDILAGRVDVRDIVAEVRRAVAQVRRQGVDVVVVVLHSGLGAGSGYDSAATGRAENVAQRVAQEVRGIDLIVFGHTHNEEAGLTSGSTLLVQPRQWATSLAVAKLRVTRAGVVERRSSVVQAAGHREAPAVVNAVQRAHEGTQRHVTTAIGRTPVAWSLDSARFSDTPIVDFINEVQRRRTGSELSATSVFVAGGRLDSGAVTIAQIARIYPYENTLRAVRISGAQLRAYLEHSARYYRPLGAQPPVDPAVPGYNFDVVSGADYVIDVSRPVGARITQLRVKGREVTDADTFTMALNHYRQGGGGGYTMLRDAPVVWQSGDDIRELLIDEVRRRGTLRPEDYFVRNWQVEPAAAVAALGAHLAAAPSGAAHLRRGRWLRVIATNDFHGALEPRADSSGVVRGGAAYLAAEIRARRAECQPPSCASVWLDGGDLFQGTPASNMAFGVPVLEIFNRLDLTAAALGNHEFDWGLDTLRARMRQARFGILGANVRDTQGRDVEWIRDDTLAQVGSLRIGIIGAALEATPLVTKRAIVKDLRFVDPVPIIDARARALRQRGADAVVVVAHIGSFCGATLTSCRGEIVDLAARLTEPVDAIVSGHTHSPVRALVNGIPIVQARSRSTALGVIDVPLGESSDEPRIDLHDVRADRIAPDTAVAALVAVAAERVRQRMSIPVVEVAEHIEMGLRNPLGSLIADAQRAAGAGDVGIMNNGGVRAPIRRGMATVGSLYEVHPFENRLVRLTVTGADLRAELERQAAQRTFNWHLSGIRVVLDTTRSPGARVVRVTRTDRRPLRDDATYRVIVSDFLADEGDGMLLARDATRREELAIVDLDALIAYLKTLPAPVQAPRDPRVTFVR